MALCCQLESGVVFPRARHGRAHCSDGPLVILERIPWGHLTTDEKAMDVPALARGRRVAAGRPNPSADRCPTLSSLECNGSPGTPRAICRRLPDNGINA